MHTASADWAEGLHPQFARSECNTNSNGNVPTERTGAALERRPVVFGAVLHECSHPIKAVHEFAVRQCQKQC